MTAADPASSRRSIPITTASPAKRGCNSPALLGAGRSGSEEVVAFTGQNPHAETWQMPRMVYDAEDHVGGALVAFCDASARVRDWGGAPRRDGARDVRKEPDSMRATQFVRRGLIAFAAVATLTLGLAGVASAQSPGAVLVDDDAIVFGAVPATTMTSSMSTVRRRRFWRLASRWALPGRRRVPARLRWRGGHHSRSHRGRRRRAVSE